jgi:hypothetical protein
MRRARLPGLERDGTVMLQCSNFVSTDGPAVLFPQIWPDQPTI